MLSAKSLSKFELFLLWRVLLYGPVSLETLTEDLGVPFDTVKFFVIRLSNLHYLERDWNYAKTHGYVFVASSRRDTEDDLES